MSTSPQPYPGSAASATDVVLLANAYRRAAKSLLTDPRYPLSRAPVTLCAIHAIELYLNAFLRNRGKSAAELRGHLHDIASSTAMAVEHGLVLRKRTIEHLAKVTRDREYLISRYGPEKVSTTLSVTTRLMATLEEIAEKVIRHIERSSFSQAMHCRMPSRANGPPQTGA